MAPCTRVGLKVEQTERPAPGADGLGMDRVASRGSALVDSRLATLPIRPCPLPSPSGSPFRHVPTQHPLGLNAVFPTRIVGAPAGGELGSQITTARTSAGDGRPNAAIRELG